MTELVSQQPVQPTNSAPSRRSVRDYQFGTRIGEGSYSTVYLAVDLYNKKTYAVKVLSKKHIVQEDKIKYVNIEKTALHRLGQQHPGIVQLYYTFQDELKLYFVLDFAEYGELLSIISKFGSLLEAVLKFYMLQILDAVKFIHLKGIIHRDLKPENILVGYDFNLKMTDFGTAKLLGTENDEPQERINYDNVSGEAPETTIERKGSFVGTAEYVPPELLKHNACGFETDVWAIACILYQFFNGLPPFKGSTEYLTFEKIIHVDYTYKRQMPNLVKEIIDKILVYAPQDRPTITEIQSMRWFSGVPWNNRDFLWSRAAPRFEPYNAPHIGTASTQQYVIQPQIKTGTSRQVNKSNSNYKLLSQIQRSDNLIPTIGTDKNFRPANRMHRMSQSPSTPKAQTGFPTLLQSESFGASAPVFAYSDDQMNYDRSPGSIMQWRQVSPGRYVGQGPGTGLINGINNVGENSPGPYYVSNGIAPNFGYPNEILSPSSNRRGTAFNLAKQASQAAMSPLEKRMSGTNLGTPFYGERKNLPQNSALASLKRPEPESPASTVSTVSTASIASPSSNLPSTKPTTPKQVSKQSKSKGVQSATITLKQVMAFLSASEKIVKLDSILKIRIPNNVSLHKKGNLDNESIEKMIDENLAVLEDKIVPAVACVTNRARVLLIDRDMDVLTIDLTANSGTDYLMYDYEFESLMVDSDDSDGDQGEEVYGYLILELIKDNGDLVFLKRFSDELSPELVNSVRVIKSNGDTLKIGRELGWIDCLIRTKKIMDDEKQKLSACETTNSNVSSVPKSSSAVGSKNSSPRGKMKSSGEGKTLTNFAMAAAAAAHR